MADEQEAIAPSGQDTATAPEATTTPETEIRDEPERIPDSLEAGQEAVETAEDDDTEDVEWNGKKFKGPKGLKDGILMHADYTKKRQADAEKARALDTREAQIEERLKATDAELDMRAHLRSVNAELERFKAYDWNAYQMARQTDPLAADEAWNYAQHMRNQKAELEKNLGAAQTQRSQAAQRDIAKRIEEAGKWAQTNIKGWSPEIEKKVVGFAVESRIPRDFLARNMSPVLLDVLHKAYMGDQLLKTQTTAPKPPGPAPAPLATVNGRSSPAARGDLASMDMDAYAAARKRGVGGKATVR